VSRSRHAALALSGLLAVTGCAAGAQAADGPPVRDQAQTRADIDRYAAQTAEIMKVTSRMLPPHVTVADCAGGLYSMQAVYRIPLGVRWHPRARARLRSTWLANRMPLTLDTSSDGYRGAISTVTADGYGIDVLTVAPKPRALSLQVRSPCLRAP
jgi:hypothetical protein